MILTFSPQVYCALCPDISLPKPRTASLRSLLSPSQANPQEPREILDSNALVIYFPAPNTATGEDILELHIHGGPAIVKAVLAAIGRCNTLLPQHTPHRVASSTPNIRYADPGEFTKRAFYNDRITLLGAEALGDSLSAVTEEQRLHSISSAKNSGTLTERYEQWRQMLLSARGELEALIDFSEDQHFNESPMQICASVATQVQELDRAISVVDANAVKGELLRNGIKVALLGMPNVGKSSLLNLIVGRNAAIVSRDAGTTRDVVEIGIDLGGFLVRVGDTAGVRSNSGNKSTFQNNETKPVNRDMSADAEKMLDTAISEIEMEGIRRAKSLAAHSDVVVLVLCIQKSLQSQGAQLQFDAEIIETANELIGDGKRVIIVINKMDMYDEVSADDQVPQGLDASLKRAVQGLMPSLRHENVFCISAQQALEDRVPRSPVSDLSNFQSFLHFGLIREFKALTDPVDAGDVGSTMITADATESLGATERQRALLEECRVNLQTFLAQVAGGQHLLWAAKDEEPLLENDEVDIVAAAESLRSAAQCLAKLTGKGEGSGDVEDVLGVVFEK